MSEYWRRVQDFQTDTEQQIVFDEDVSRVVIAGPGSGKTYLLTTKVAKLLHTSIVNLPHRIACLTYSNFLANQLREDLQTLQVLDDERIFVGTVHSFCIAEVILPFQKLYQLRVPDILRIASWEEMIWATKQALIVQNLNPPDRNKLEDLTRKLSNYRRLYWDTNRKDFPENSISISQLFPKLNWAQLAEDYSNFLWGEENPSVDFVHLEIEALKTIQSHKLVQQSLAARFPWWVIDEYQDLGQPFHQMMLCLLQNTEMQLLAIGDPDQCIYEELQGSKPELIYELSKVIQAHGGSDLITLKTNYRSIQDIIDLSEVVLGEERGYLANASIDAIQPTCISYHMSRPSFQSKLIRKLLNELTQDKGLQLDQIAILHPFRNGVASLNEISYMLDGRNWANMLDKDPDYNDRRVKLVEWVEQLAQWCAKEHISSRPYFTDLLPVWIELLENHQGYSLLEERFRQEKYLFEGLWNLRDETMNLREWLESLRENLKLDPIIKSYEVIRPDDAKEFFHLCDVVQTGRRLPNWDVARFAKSGKRIQLTTLHSSKGAQFEAVILAGFDRIGFGERKYSPEALDKRLAYVGVTRAKKYLYLLHSDQGAHFVSRVTEASTGPFQTHK
ncbi:MAG: ATP-dependent helicase [Ardenticatenaceae bacterium]|nr:ATP-dependent helicase [Ardenticatenaceae bacterium]MCB9444984.1 ATP-dependent helicase [Ardenticatenaceae bacterium]